MEPNRLLCDDAVGRRLNERLLIWCVAGSGVGEFTLTPEDEPRPRADMELMRAGPGLRGAAVDVPDEVGAELLVLPDALIVCASRRACRPIRVSLAAAEAIRLRQGLDGLFLFDFADQVIAGAVNVSAEHRWACRILCS